MHTQSICMNTVMSPLGTLPYRSRYQIYPFCNGHSQNKIKCSAIIGVFVIESHVVQVCVMALDSDLFLTTLLQRYKLDPWFKFGDFASTTQPADTDVQQVRYHVLLYYFAHYMYICNLYGRFNHNWKLSFLYIKYCKLRFELGFVVEGLYPDL
jgi:hypothetical protein